jgi:hypothetical protein
MTVVLTIRNASGTTPSAAVEIEEKLAVRRARWTWLWVFEGSTSILSLLVELSICCLRCPAPHCRHARRGPKAHSRGRGS